MSAKPASQPALIGGNLLNSEEQNLSYFRSPAFANWPWQNILTQELHVISTTLPLTTGHQLEMPPIRIWTDEPDVKLKWQYGNERHC